MGSEAPRHDAETIHAIGELLFRAAAEHEVGHTTNFHIGIDLETNTKLSEVIVPFSRLPESLRSKIDSDVERQVIAYLGDLDLFVRAGQHVERGRCFHVALPPELVGLSWDQFRNQRR